MKTDLKDAKVLVTGGAGCIGSHLVQKLCEIGATVTIFDNLMRGEEAFRNLKEVFETCNANLVVGDILDFEKVKEIFNDNFDFVYHLAALPSHRALHWRNLENTQSLILLVQLISLKLQEYAKQLLRGVFASSNKV